MGSASVLKRMSWSWAAIIDNSSVSDIFIIHGLSIGQSCPGNKRKMALPPERFYKLPVNNKWRYMTKYIAMLVLIVATLPASAQELSEASEKLFSSTFSETRKHHYVNSQYAFFSVTNLSQKDIDDVVLSLALMDSHKEVLARTAVNVITPGMVWLKAGESTELGVPLDDYPDAKALMSATPEAASLRIEVRRITFMDEHKPEE